jgi:glycerol-3-phosphate acyltransferase PlsY
MTYIVAIIFISYLIGSIPFGFLIGRMLGIDVRKHGSGNIGATNVFRILGAKWGILVFFCDAGKGVGAVLLAKWLAGHFPADLIHGPVMNLRPANVPPIVGGILAAIWCIVGHSFPIWLRFRGGKGVATSAGVMFGLLPLSSFTGFVVWVIVYYSTRYVSVASMAASCALALSVLVIPNVDDRIPLFILACVAVVIIFWRHRANIHRLRTGTEHRFEKKKKSRD